MYIHMMPFYHFTEEKTNRRSPGRNKMKPRGFDEAFEPYRTAFISGDLEQQRSIINEFISSLVSTEATKLAEERSVPRGNLLGEDNSLEKILTCGKCHELFHIPVTLQCGHTFCSECLDICRHEDKTICPGCGKDSKLQYTSNIAIRELSRLWLPEKTEIRSSIADATKLLKEGRINEFMDFMKDILCKYPNSVDLLCLRAYGHKSVKSYSEAMKDLDFAFSLAPFNSKVLHGRGELLTCMDQPEEAMAMFIRAAALKPEEKRYRYSLASYLETLLRNICEVNPDVMPYSANSRKSNFNATTEHEHFTNKKLVKTAPKPKQESASNSQQNGQTAWVIETPLQACSTAVCHEKADDMFDDKESSFRAPVENVKTNSAAPPCFDTRTATPQPKLDIPSELECKLCFNLVYDPVTTSCGHSLCRSCLCRCLDHRFDCPYCRTNLQRFLQHLTAGNVETCEVLKEILMLKFQDDYEKRRIAHEKELLKFSSCESKNDEIPIFVCTLAVPGVACPLHIFEPRYKLMVRRCLESGSRQFGMCVPDPVEGFATVGTMLYINDANFLPDGRSIIHTVGTRRFKVLERGMQDGYSTAKVAWLEDEYDERDYAELNYEVYNMMIQWLAKLPSEQQTCITKAVGRAPDAFQSTIKNGPQWLWWLLAALPLNVEAKRIILSMTSVIERLNSAKRFLAILLSRQ